ncbi:AraC family transcriptional regulator [Sphaerimonospora sp. CA-214678]|uniref:AraC family transcriptional regulator n=1 Tax=Sphaerimonospora sp. CA-214678 TaxID=3240029 RepID=UPI003D8E6CF7
MSAWPLPLAAYERLRTHDLDEARAEVAEVFCPHGLRLADRGARLDTRMNAAVFDRTGLYCLDYGAEVVITPNALESFFLVQIPLAGVAEVTQGKERVVSTAGLPTVLSATERLSMRWGAGAPHLVVWFDRAALEARLGGILGREPRTPLVFSLGMDLTRSPSRSWLSVVDMIRQDAETGGGMLSQPSALRQAEGLLMTQLLLAQPSTYTSALTSAQPRIAPRAVKRAMELIETHPAEPLTTGDIAEAVGVGERALYEGFRRHLNTTPRSYLRDVRLDRAHAELTACGPDGTTVTDVAFQWGFVHLGRFARAYRERFGENPSATLRR